MKLFADVMLEVGAKSCIRKTTRDGPGLFGLTLELVHQAETKNLSDGSSLKIHAWAFLGVLQLVLNLCCVIYCVQDV